MRYKLTKISNNENALRTDTVEGEIVSDLEVGSNIVMFSEPLKDGFDGRKVVTTRIVKIEGNLYHTRNSIYELEEIGRINYQKGNLLDHVSLFEGIYIAHAVNCQGVWGSGFALALKHAYPVSMVEYEGFCSKLRDKALGGCSITSEGIINLYSSYGYGKLKCSPEDILVALEDSLHYLFSDLPAGSHIHSPKLCSGLFNVPWDRVEKLINEALPENVKWTVWCLE